MKKLCFVFCNFCTISAVYLMLSFYIFIFSDMPDHLSSVFRNVVVVLLENNLYATSASCQRSKLQFAIR